jgi:hypothetical protein
MEGTLEIEFDTEIFKVPDLLMLSNGTMYLDESMLNATMANETSIERRLKSTNSKRIPILQVKVLPGPDSDLADLGFSWNVTSQEDRKLAI